mgnify:CR=1 FL=1
MTKIDYENDRMQSVEQIDSAKRLSDKILELKDFEDEIANAEESLKKLKEKARAISCIEIPKMMDEMQIAKGRNESDSDFLDRKDKAFTWLRDNGLGDIIKNDITVTFGRGEDNKAASYAELAKGQGFQPTQKMKVEPMTLKALVRERIEAGKEMPTEIFGVFSENKTTIKRNK